MQSGGTSTDGNSARKFFTNPELRNQAVKLVPAEYHETLEDIFMRVSVILRQNLITKNPKNSSWNKNLCAIHEKFLWSRIA